MDMEELIELIVKKTGISEEIATKVVDMVLDFLKDKLPEPIAGQLDNLLSGEGIADDLLGGLGSLFGG
jgi:nucleoid DNA-binding protein